MTSSDPSVIFKYEIPLTHSSTIKLPAGAKILKARMTQDCGAINLWAMVDVEGVPTERTFQVHGTGHGIAYPNRLRYIDSVFDDRPQAMFVWHLFEQITSS